jgi:hypothetical protein
MYCAALSVEALGTGPGGVADMNTVLVASLNAAKSDLRVVRVLVVTALIHFLLESF